MQPPAANREAEAAAAHTGLAPVRLRPPPPPLLFTPHTLLQQTLPLLAMNWKK